MTKRMLIDATHKEELRVAITDGNRLVEYDYESQNRKPLKGSIFLAKVTRVEPSLQAAFVNFGGNRHGFLPFSEIHPDYFRIPVSDREALMAEQEALIKEHDEEEALDDDDIEGSGDDDDAETDEDSDGDDQDDTADDASDNADDDNAGNKVNEEADAGDDNTGNTIEEPNEPNGNVALDADQNNDQNKKAVVVVIIKRVVVVAVAVAVVHNIKTRMSKLSVVRKLIRNNVSALTCAVNIKFKKSLSADKLCWFRPTRKSAAIKALRLALICLCPDVIVF